MRASQTLFRAYPLAVLVGVALVSPLPFPFLALALFFAWGYALLRPLPYPWNLALDLGTYLMVPLGLVPVASWGLLIALPLLVLVDGDLRVVTRYQMPQGYAPGRRTTPLLNGLLLAGVVAEAGGLVTGSFALVLAASALLAYLLARLGYSL